MKLIRYDKRCEYILVDVTPEELAVLSAAVQIFGEDVAVKYSSNCTKTRETIERVKNSFLADNTLHV